MPQLERGVYEPPEDSRVFDGAEDEADDGGSRLTLLILIALVVLAAFFGVVWLAYYQGVQHGRAVAPRVVASQEGPNAQREVPFKGLKIYQQPAPADDGASDEDTAPQPPTMISPTRRPVLSQRQLAAGTPSSHVPFAFGLKAKSGILRPVQDATQPTAPVQAQVAPTRAATKPPVQLTQAPAAAPARTASAPATPAPTASAPAKPSPAAAKPVVAAPSRPSGAFVLQIGAYKSEAEARGAWRAYEAKHPLVGGYEPDIRKADLAGKGTWYRLRIGAFPSSADAGTLCEKLKADGATCFPAKR